MITKEQLLQLMKNHPSVEYVKDLNLTPEELSILETMIDEYQSIGVSKTEEVLRVPDFERQLVTPLQFITDKNYLGRCKVYPGVKKDFVKICSSPVPIIDIILAGSLRWGKSYLCALLSSWHLYKLSCMRNPVEYLGLDPGSTIYFINLSVTGSQASEGIFSTVRNITDASPYFKECLPRNTRIKSVLNFETKNIIFKSGNSSEFSAIGKDVYGGIVDESNFFGIKKNSSRSTDVSGDYDAAKVLYDALSRRIKLTYTKNGISAGFAIISSSARYPQDYIERKIKGLEERALKGNPDHQTIVLRHTTWGVQDPSTYVKPKFFVEVGNSQIRSRVLGETYDKTKVRGKVISVPGEFKQIFLEDVDSALRDLAGESTRSISPFFSNLDLVNRSFVSTYEHPWSEGDDVSINLGGYLEVSKMSRQNKKTGKYYPIFSPSALRVVAIDLSKNRDSTSVSMGHISGYKKVRIQDPDSLEEVEISRPIIRVDFTIKIKSEPNSEINYERVVQLVSKFMLFGFNIHTMVGDQYGSTAAILQKFRQKGIRCFQQSTHRRKFTPYHRTKAAMYEERFICYWYTPLHDEIVELEDREGYIDHPPQGSNDNCDSLVNMTDVLEEMFYNGEYQTVPVYPEDSGPEKGLLPPIPVGTDPESLFREFEPEIRSYVTKYVLQGIRVPWEKLTRVEAFQVQACAEIEKRLFQSIERYTHVNACDTIIQEYKRLESTD